ncbi:MAG: chloride channel protein, partial [Candidatus Dormibacteraceae bacterium]
MTRPAPRRRVRVPAPVLPRRLPSGRGATEQPNASGDGDAELSLEFWIVLVLTGVLSGLFGDLMMLILRLVQRVAFGYDVGTFAYLGPTSFQHGVGQAPELRRLVALLVAGVLCGGAWYLVRRYTPGAKTNAEDEVWTGTGNISFRRGIVVAVFSEVAVGLGASMGREAAPRLLGAASGSVLGRWRGFTPAQRRLLVACGAGAGLAAVYNLPLAGALFIA